MDVQADKASGVRSDPPPTLAVSAPEFASGVTRSVHQGSFFQDDPYPTYAKTDPTPVVRLAPTSRTPRSSRGLRIAVVVVAIAVAAAGATLGLVEAGVIHTTGGTGRHSATPPPVTHPSASAAPKHTLLTPAGFGAGSVAYTVDASAFGLTITTSTGRSWVSVGIVGQKPIFAGIVAANSSQHVTLLGPAQLSIGAGGTKVTVTSDRRSQTLTPPSAPFSYQFTPR